MLTYIVLALACIGMYRLAEVDGKSGAMWAAITFVLGFGAALFIGILGPGVGMVLAFLAMFASNFFGD